LRSKRAV